MKRFKIIPSLINLFKYSERLIEGVIIALVWANTDYASLQKFLHGSPFDAQNFLGFLNFHFLINEIFLVFFFGIATKEITQACLSGGDLNPIKKAMNPLMATLGGVIGPICVYFIFVWLTGDFSLARGWAVPTATDIALAWLVARFAFGEGHPAIPFLLLLAVVDDGIGLAIIAIFYPDPVHPVQPVYLVLVLLGMALAYLFRKRQVSSFWPYILVGGTLTWFGLYMAHLHPALALVPIVPFLPSIRPARDPLNAFQDFFKQPVGIGLLGFGLANAGVPFSSVGPATWAVLLSLMIGKTVGVFLFSMAAVNLGFPLPTGMDKKSLFVAAMTAAIGMTVALFVAGVAFIDLPTQEAAKMGALLSCGMVIPVLIVANILKVKKKH
jgi:NhaA family Na+:H+ antiporter